MSFLEVLRTAVFALRGNWLRSALTSLGVIIGIAAVIVMVSVGQGTQAEIDKLVSGLGSNRLDIGGAGGPRLGGARIGAGSCSTLDRGRCRRDPRGDPGSAVRRGGTARQHAARLRREQLVDAVAGRAAGLLRHQRLGARRPATASRPGDYNGGGKSVIIGETVRRELFGDEDALGQTVRIGRVPFTVVGMLEPKGQGGFGQDQDDVVMVPLETARRRLMGAIGPAAGRGAADRAGRRPRRGPGLRAGRGRGAAAPAPQDPARRGGRLQRAQHRRDRRHAHADDAS